MIRELLASTVAVLVLVGRAEATVYRWRDADGVFHFTNREEEVPPGPLDAFRAFSELEPPPAAPSDVGGAGDTGIRSDAVAEEDAYAAGIEAGLRIAEEQLRLAQELARAAEDESPPVVAPVVEVAPAPPVVVSVVPAVAPAYYGWRDPCGPWGCSSWIVGPALLGRPLRHGRFAHRRHGFARRHGFLPVKHTLRGAPLRGRGLRLGGSCFGRRR